MTIKSYADWNCDLKDYLQIGDLVDEEMVDYFISVMPPATMNGECVQMGEAYSHIKGRATYATLSRTRQEALSNKPWKYAGNCYRGETQQPMGGQ